MKLLLINSSYRDNGNTGTIMKLLEHHLVEKVKKQEESLEIDHVWLKDLDITTCKGCRVCFQISESKCPLKDDLLKLYEKMKQADGIVLGSPVYVEDVNGSMKNFIDRMAFSCHRPFLAGKPVLLIVTSGSFATNHAVRTMSGAISAWGGIVSGSSSYQMGAIMKEETAKRRFSEKARSQSLLLIQAIKDKKPSVLSLVSFADQQRYWLKEENQNSIDFLYWKEKGWLEKKCYYYDTKIKHSIRMLLARILGQTAFRLYAKG